MQLDLRKNTSHNSGFTLMEVLLVTIVIAIISGFALPNFTRAMRKAQVRDAQAQLSAVYAANMIERSKTNSFFVLDTTPLLPPNRILAINNTLGINLVANGLTYNYVGAAAVFTATAGIPGVFSVRINERQINPLAVSPNRNPCCLPPAGSCPGLGAC